MTDTNQKLRKFYDSMGPYYDKFMEQGESKLEDELNLIKLVFTKPCTLLDVGCGTGRITIPLQKIGYDIVGLDISKKMIKEAINNGLKKYNIGDIKNSKIFPKYKKFEGVISLHMGFSYEKNRNDIERIIRHCYKLLVKGGKLIWDTPNEEYYGKQRILKWPAGNKYVEINCFGYKLSNLRPLFLKQGFKIKKIWGTYTPLQEYKKSLPRIIIYAEKK